MERRIKHLMAMGRKETDGRGNIQIYGGHACHHYEEILLAFAGDEIRYLVEVNLKGEFDPAECPPDTPVMREALRTFVGYGMDEEGTPWVAVCHDDRCYPTSWSDQQIRQCEVFVHGVVTGGFSSVAHGGPITQYTVPGPLAYCQKVCYKRTPHFFDIEVWDEGMAAILTHRKERYQIVLRCENCHHGYDLVTKEGSPSRWRRLMKDETARRLLAGAMPDPA